jgi:hypothetical protein
MALIKASLAALILHRPKAFVVHRAILTHQDRASASIFLVAKYDSGAKEKGQSKAFREKPESQTFANCSASFNRCPRSAVR